MIDLGDRISIDAALAPAEVRRRIEIRVRRSDAVTGANPPASSERKSALSVSGAQKSTSAVIAGKATIIDGDTLDVGGKRIRIWGIDAVENDQRCTLNGKPWDCGVEAKLALAKFLSDKEAVCTRQSLDRFGRTVAQCAAGGVDLGGWIVEQGHALDFPEYSSGYYAEQQARAQSGSKGLWRGQFLEPWEWRRVQSAGRP